MPQHADDTEKRLTVIRDSIARMPSLSTTAMKVAEICNNPQTSPADLNRIISLDPVLTGRVLKLVNSAYYGLPTQITSLTRAIIMVGLNTIVNLVISTAVVEKVSVKNASGPLSVDDFWTHSLCVGVVAKFLADLRGIPAASREEYFVGGLLHDLGKVALNDCFSEEYRQVFERATKGEASLCEAEAEAFGVHHGRVGLMIAEKWQLGAALRDSLAHHHDPREADEAGRNLVTLVSLGDGYANILGMGSPGYPRPDESALSSLLEEAKIRPNALSDYQEKVLEEIEKARVFIRISSKG
jgi:putative nucleotidyltransferase with HDIG domain